MQIHCSIYGSKDIFRHLDSFITSILSQVTTTADPSSVYSALEAAQLPFVFEYCCPGSTGPSTRSADSGLADTDPDLMSFATSATGYCRAEIKARPWWRKVSNARRGDETEEEGKEGNIREIVLK